MNTVFGDFESFFDKEYSLRKMSPVEYILDPRFETIGIAVKHGHPSNDQTPYWVEGPDVQKFFDGLDPNNTCLVTHNALFDACICAWRYGFVPKLLADTLAVSRACLGHLLRSHSLANVGMHLELGVKGNALSQAIGMHLADIKANPGFYLEYIAYALNDVELCAGIYDKLVRSGVFPAEELLVDDMVLRCAVNPKFRLNTNVLAEHLQSIQVEKDSLLASSGLYRDEQGKVPDLMSNDKFAALLRTHGVEPPTKISKTTGKVTYAFAKTDPGLIELEEHPNLDVQTLVAARCGFKSTIEETRTKRMMSIASLGWPSAPGATSNEQFAPVPLRNHAAHTHRLGGEWKLNYQNLQRNSRIKEAHEAGYGNTFILADAAQIEARGVATICGQDDLRQQFADGVDVYADFAGTNFGRPINKDDNPGERFIGKIGILQLGYQAGWMSYQNALRVQSLSQLGYEIKIDDVEAQKVVSAYRSKYSCIKSSWNVLQNTGVDVLAHGGTAFQFGGCVFEKGSILLPNGLRLFYHDLEYRDNEWWFTYAGKPEKIYGGKLLENITQALARIATMQAGVRTQKRLRPLGAELAIQVHDSLGYVVKDEFVGHVTQVIREEMSKSPDWMPRWPLAVEIQKGANYGQMEVC